jgi:hypothetical protein
MRFPYVVLLSAFALLWTATLLAQSPNGVINGLVVDPSNRVVVGADVVVENDVTGLKYTTKTNDEGIYVLPNLAPGPYRLQVSKIGFKTTIKPDIVLNVQDALSINFTLRIGASYETVTVEAGASMINTTDASVSTVIDQTYVKNMPLNGRSFQDLILLAPGIVTQTPQNSSTLLGRTGEFSVNGQRQESNYYTVDGVSANVGVGSDNTTIRADASGSLAASTTLGTTQALVSVDDLQEFRVQSSSYSAEYGRNPGGQFSFVTRSGTNQWHGTAYDYLRNGFFDAQDWFNNYFGLKQPGVRQNDFGGVLGGPVEIPSVYDGKNKTFFLVSYEGLRLVAPKAAVASPVPDLCMRSMGACPSGRVPAATALQPVVNAFPVPSSNGLEDAANGVGQFIGSWSNPSSIDSTSFRVDHVVNDKLKLFFRFSNTTSSSATRRPVFTTPPTLVVANASILRTYTAGANYVLTNRLNNEFRANRSTNEASAPLAISPFGGSSPVNLWQLTGLAPNSAPSVIFFLGPNLFLLGQGPGNKGAQNQWNLIDTVSLLLGHHQVKLGGDFRRLSPSSFPPSLIPQYFFFGETAVESNSAFYGPGATVPAHPLFRNFSAFVQDEWKVSPRLSLSLGLRWEINPPPGVTRGLLPYTVQGTGPDNWTLATQGTPLWQTTWYNFAPRLGAAYSLNNTLGRETVVRGGGGVFFDTGQQLGAVGFNGPGFSNFTFQPGSFPGNPSASAPPIVNPPVPPFNQVYANYAHLQLPYTLQWNASIEQALGKSQALRVSYVGSHGVRLLKFSEFRSSVNPISSDFLIVQNGLTSDYDSLQIQFQRRLSQGLTGLASYSWSHCFDYGSQNYGYGYLRGNCDFDVRNNLSAAFSYDLPNAAGEKFLGAVLNHWGLDGHFIVRGAFPVTLDGLALLQPNGQIYHAGLNLVPGQPVYLYGANCESVLQGLQNLKAGQGCPGGRAINPLAFTNVSSGVGDAPRNFTRGFGAWQMNMGIRRDFPIRERVKLQFRAEAFNLSNHPNFGTINPNFGTNTFGQATATLANSLGVLNPLYQVGGPRSMQFALKLLF